MKKQKMQNLNKMLLTIIFCFFAILSYSQNITSNQREEKIVQIVDALSKMKQQYFTN